MGQMVAVTEEPSSTPGVVRYVLNRTLTGMGHEYFDSPAAAVGSGPAAVLARRLFATEQVDGVHVYANIVTVQLARGGSTAPIAGVIGELYRYWHPGMQPPTFDDLTADEPAAAGDGEASAGSGDEDPAMAAARKLVPAALLERGRAARERWKAKHG